MIRIIVKWIVPFFVLAGVVLHFAGVPSWDIFRILGLAALLGTINFGVLALWAMSDDFTF